MHSRRGEKVSLSLADQRGFVMQPLVKRASMVLAAVLIFMLGLFIGSGRLTFGMHSSSNKNLPADLNYSSVEQVYDLLKNSFDGQLDANKLLDGLKGGLAKASGDPYTQYFTPDESKKFTSQLKGSFSGIGAELGQNENDNLIIVSPIEGFPASKAGLRPKDLIISINDKSTVDMSVEEAVSLIRGPKDTQVTLHILRNKTEELTFTITRADIQIPSVKWQVLDGEVGYIQISQFGEDTVNLMTTAATELKAQGAKRILLDLRGNPGGLLQSAVEVSSMWLPEGKTILQEKKSGIISDTFKSETAAMPAFHAMPTVVLVNAGSASASEIVAGALRDNNVAVVYGEKSYGKGSVQEVRNLPNGGSLKITIARWYRPNGQNIDKKGINPDKEIKMTEEDFKNGKDPQKDAALDYLRNQ